MQLIPVDNIDSGYAAVWAARIGSKLDEGWRTAYSDGSGCQQQHAAASHTVSRRQHEPPLTTSQFLGTLGTVADAERTGLALSLEANMEKSDLVEEFFGYIFAHFS